MTQETLLKKGLQFSLGIHLAFALLIGLKSLLIPDAPREMLPALRVDLVALPDRVPAPVPQALPSLEPIPTPAAPPPAPIPAPTAAPVNPPAPVSTTHSTERGDYSIAKKKKRHREHSKKEKDAAKKLKQAIARIRAIERIKALAGVSAIKGNQISKGSSLTGEAKKTLESTYFEVVLERVRSYWELPKWLQEQNRSAKVMIFLDAQGRMKSFQMVQSSGSEPFDSEVKRTLQAAAPFPVPPTAISSEIGKAGILLGFPL